MDPASKQDITDLRIELKQDITDLRIELKQDITDLRIELKQDMSHLEERMLEQMRSIETTLLTEFRKWAVPMTARTKVFEAVASGLTERVSLLEERVNTLEK